MNPLTVKADEFSGVPKILTPASFEAGIEYHSASSPLGNPTICPSFLRVTTSSSNGTKPDQLFKAAEDSKGNLRSMLFPATGCGVWPIKV